MQHLPYIIFVFAIGACVGSFLNVVVWRLPRDESLVTPPSRCPKCGHRLAWFDNLPIVGWIFLRGKCRYCKQPISPRYPIVEASEEIVQVLHGHGSGALKSALREHLARSPYVARSRPGESHEGGDAVTVVSLRG